MREMNHKHRVVLAIVSLWSMTVSGQLVDTATWANISSTTGFVYSPGIQWTESRKGDSVLTIVIERDTMTTIKNLLTYCLQEKEEGDYARILLSMINLEHLKGLFKDKYFDFYLIEYKKAVNKNKQNRDKRFPRYGYILQPESKNKTKHQP